MTVSLFRRIIVLIGFISLVSCVSSTSGPEAGSGLLPVPQELSFSGKSISISDRWSLNSDLPENDPAVKSLQNGIFERTGIRMAFKQGKKSSHQIILQTVPVSVNIPSGAKQGLSEQAYSLKLKAEGISLTANSAAGLYYGVQTLLQLLHKDKEKVTLPEGVITDWPDLETRMIYWDCAHHLDRKEALMDAIQTASHYKINAFALKLEGHFQYKSAAPVVEPYAFTPAEYQELTDYALSRHVQLVPYLDAPAHVSFILKHPEYAALRAFQNSNYEFSITNEGTYELLSAMFGELIEANRGGKFILLSTDEAYYAGHPENERAAAARAGSNGKLLASFITRLADELHGKGRTVISWCEYPLKETDIEALPSHLVNGVYNKEWAGAFRKKGIRQFIYTSTQGEEPLFPDYYMKDGKKGRIEQIILTIQESVAGGKDDIPGLIIAAWGDAGLHPGSFWLGYSAGAAAAWNLNSKDASDLSRRFYETFYGDQAEDMEKIYTLLCSQAQYWNNSWKWKPSDLRSPILGNSQGMFDKPRPAKDQTLPLPLVPTPEDLDVPAGDILRFPGLDQAGTENEELAGLLKKNIEMQSPQSHNLEILLSITRLCRQNLDMLSNLAAIDSLVRLSSSVASNDRKLAVSLLDSAIEKAKSIIESRDTVLREVVDLWYHDWYPVVEEANGRRFLFRVDDVKDHRPGRTTDLSYLVYRELHYPLEKWIKDLTEVRDKFASPR